MKEKIIAGDFVEWLNQFKKSLKTKNGMTVPCGKCRGCCKSAMFIHVNVEEKETIKNIPKKYLFKAPNLPDGNFILGYNSKGHCPMFDGKQCTIYEFRPITCRMFDCRLFAATELFLEYRAEISKRVKQWEFKYLTQKDIKKHEQIKHQARLLGEQNTALNEIEIALMSIKKYKSESNPLLTDAARQSASFNIRDR